MKEIKNARLVICPSMTHRNAQQLLKNSNMFGTRILDGGIRIPFVTTAAVVLPKTFDYRLITEPWLYGCAKTVNLAFIDNYIVAFESI